MVSIERHLVVGLGNPGKEYEKTRHNIGFMVVDRIAQEYGTPLVKKKFNAIYGQGIIEEVPVILAKPQAFMNRSGLPARQLSDYFGIDSRNMLVIHDDVDLSFERIKIKEKGGDGGHKGIRSIISTFGVKEFTRVRIGIGRAIEDSEERRDVVNHVLGRFYKEEARKLDEIISRAREAVATVLGKGTMEGMNIFNRR
jgi:peptidyl-tRNA hydrolase, PTH1 family